MKNQNQEMETARRILKGTGYIAAGVGTNYRIKLLSDDEKVVGVVGAALTAARESEREKCRALREAAQSVLFYYTYMHELTVPIKHLREVLAKTAHDRV